MGHLVQMAGLAVQNFVSAAVGIAVAVALVRGFARTHDRPAGQLLGRPGPDRAPDAAADRGRRRDRARRRRRGAEPLRRHRRARPWPARPSTSPAARWPARRSSRSSAPTAAASTTPTARTRSRTRPRWTNWLEIFLLLVIPFSLPRTFGRMVGDNRQGYAIVAVMAILAIGSVVAINVAAGRCTAARCRRRSARRRRARRPGSACSQSATFAAATTLTSTGAVNSFHDSYTALGGGDADRQHDARRGRARRRRIGPVRHARSSP